MKNIDNNFLRILDENFKSNHMNDIISSNKIKHLITKRDLNQKYQHIFNHKVKPELKITNQKSSGRCWLFAALNVVRRNVIEKYNLDTDFELSQNYLFFWDKFERLNYLMEAIIETKNTDIDSRMVTHLLNDPTCDGGQWDMVSNLIRKYGIVPKSVYQESCHSSYSSEMNAILKKKFREYALVLRINDNPRSSKMKFLEEIYDLLCKFLGKPPSNFDWEYLDKNKKFHRISNLTPLEFYKNHTNFDVNEYYCIVNDPRKDNPYDKLYTVKYLGNVIDGEKIKYLNTNVNRLKELIKKSIDDNKAVWFGCDVGKWLHRDQASMDLDLSNYEGVLNTKFGMDKEERLLTGDSLMTHAMVFTGYLTDNKGKVKYWQVENSWSDKGPAKGYYVMADSWFDQYMYEIAINKKYLSYEEIKIIPSATNEALL